MRALVKVVETGSFSAAAAQLGVGQPSVSKLVAQLERHVGVPLLLRSSRRLTPTEAGKEFLIHARRSIEEADEADLAARSSNGILTGQLRFAAPPSFARQFILPGLPAFLDSCPGLRIDAALEDRPQDLIQAGVDVAFRVGPLADSSMVAKRVGRCRAMVVGSPRYLESHGYPQHPQDLAKHRTLVYSAPSERSFWTFRKGQDEETIRLAYSFRSNSIDGVCEAAVAGLGLLVMADWVVRDHLRDGRLRAVLADWALPSFDVFAVFPAGRKVSARTQAFVRFVESQIQEVDTVDASPRSAAVRSRHIHLVESTRATSSFGLAPREVNPPSNRDKGGAMPLSQFHDVELSTNLSAGRFAGLPVTEVMLARGLVILARDLHRLLQRELKPFGLTESELRMLTTVASHGGSAPTGDTGVSLAQSPANVTRISDSLVRRGLLSRHKDGVDRRRIYLTLEPEGERVVNSIIPRIAPQLVAAFSDFDAREKEQMVHNLKRILARIDALSASDCEPRERTA